MNPSDVVDKTEKGLQEVKSRAVGLQPRLRSMLIMIDGRRTVMELEQAAGSVGAPADWFDQLLQHGLVALRPGAASRAAPPARSSAPAPAIVADLPLDLDGSAQALATARKLMNDSVVDSLGVRAVFFSLKVERCFTRDDLVALMPEYLRLLTKGSGPDAARVLEARLRELLR